MMAQAGARLDTLKRLELAEGVEIELHAAGPLVRGAAFLIDSAIFCAMYLVLLLAWMVVSIYISDEFGQGMLMLSLFFLKCFYFAMCESGRHGATPGKRMMKLKVVSTAGAPIRFRTAFVRNLLNFVDGVPFFLAFPVMLFSRNFQRCGDLVAETLVVYREPDTKKFDAVLETVPQVPPSLALSREEQQALITFAERGGTLSAARRQELAATLQPLTGVQGAAAERQVVGMAAWLMEADR